MHLVFACIGLLVGALSGFWFGDHFGGSVKLLEQRINELEAEVVQAPEIATKKYTLYTLAETKGNARANAEFPLFAIPAIDTDIAAYMQAQTNTFLNEMHETEVFPPSEEHTIAISLQRVFENEEYLSLVWYAYVDTGGAHGNTTILTKLFDKASKKALTLDDIFVDVDAALALLSKKGKANFAQFQEYAGFADGLAPTRENFERIALHEHGLLVYFPPYQIAAYAAGPQTLYMTWSELGDTVALEKT